MRERLNKNTYLIPNVPVIFPFDLVRDWPAYTDLVEGGKVHWAALASRYGDHQVPVITKSDEECHSETLKLAEAVKKIEGAPKEPIYIKDWHLVRTARTDVLSRSPDDPLDRTLPYRTPFLFADDWMNNITPPTKSDTASFLPDAWLLSESTASLESDDFRFCYAGTKGSSTPLHRDGRYKISLTQFVRTQPNPDASYSWSTNIAGRKRWRLFAPEDAHLLRRTSHAHARVP